MRPRGSSGGGGGKIVMLVVLWEEAAAAAAAAVVGLIMVVVMVIVVMVVVAVVHFLKHLLEISTPRRHYHGKGPLVGVVSTVLGLAGRVVLLPAWCVVAAGLPAHRLDNRPTAGPKRDRLSLP